MVSQYHCFVNLLTLALLLAGGPGSFLVRPSDNSPGDYSLFFHINNQIQRFRIEKKGVRYVMGGRTFDCLEAVINRYKTEQIVEGHTLGHFIKRVSESSFSVQGNFCFKAQYFRPCRSSPNDATIARSSFCNVICSLLIFFGHSFLLSDLDMPAGCSYSLVRKCFTYRPVYDLSRDDAEVILRLPVSTTNLNDPLTRRERRWRFPFKSQIVLPELCAQEKNEKGCLARV